MWYAGFALGLLSSAHCAGMCGPLHIALAGQQRSSSRFLYGRLAFNLGRVATYTLLGLFAGTVGAFGRLAFSQQTISVAAGLFMLALAVRPLFQKSKPATATPGAGLVSGLKDIFFQWMDRKSLAGQAVTGALNGLLPCGTVYLALAASLAMPTTTQSVAFMAAFGLGTLPLLLSMALAGKSISALSRRIPQIQYALPVLIAGLLIIRGVAPVLQKQASCHSQATILSPSPEHDILCSKK